MKTRGLKQLQMIRQLASGLVALEGCKFDFVMEWS